MYTVNPDWQSTWSRFESRICSCINTRKLFQLNKSVKAPCEVVSTHISSGVDRPLMRYLPIFCRAQQVWQLWSLCRYPPTEWASPEWLESVHDKPETPRECTCINVYCLTWNFEGVNCVKLVNKGQHRGDGVWRLRTQAVCLKDPFCNGRKSFDGYNSLVIGLCGSRSWPCHNECRCHVSSTASTCMCIHLISVEDSSVKNLTLLLFKLVLRT